MTNINDVPTCIIKNILSYTDVPSRIQFSSACKEYRSKYYPSTMQISNYLMNLLRYKNNTIERIKSKNSKLSNIASNSSHLLGWNVCDICLLTCDDSECCSICDKRVCGYCYKKYEKEWRKIYVCKLCLERCISCNTEFTNKTIKTKIKCAYCKKNICKKCVDNYNCTQCCKYGICNSCIILGISCKKTGKLKCKMCYT